MIQILYDFLQANGYVLELQLAICLFTYRLDRRRRYYARMAICLAGLLCVSFLCNSLPITNTFMTTLFNILFLVLEIPCVCLCHPLQARQAIFYITAACASQHISYRTAELACRFLVLNISVSSKLAGLLYVALFVAVLLPLGLFFSHRMWQAAGIDFLTNSTVLPLLIGMQLTTNLFKNILELYVPTLGYTGTTVVELFDILCCLFLIFLQCEITANLSTRHENDILTNLLYQQKQQMKLSKETVELINIKCHDIKNQISLLGKQIPSDQIKELYQTISIYDTAAETGNEALDLLLMEKKMLCENKQICFDCNVDGSVLNILKPSDVYSLFGNAIDNAIEATSQISDPERRSILLHITRKKKMLYACVENFYDGEITFQNGLPQTNKTDKSNHGFGIKSIRMIVERYEGRLSIHVKGGVFTLSILLPIPDPPRG